MALPRKSQAYLDLLTSGNPATRASQNAKIAGVCGSARHSLSDSFFQNKIGRPGTMAHGRLSFRRLEDTDGPIRISCVFETRPINMVKHSL